MCALILLSVYFSLSLHSACACVCVTTTVVTVSEKGKERHINFEFESKWNETKIIIMSRDECNCDRVKEVNNCEAKQVNRKGNQIMCHKAYTHNYQKDACPCLRTNTCTRIPLLLLLFCCFFFYISLWSLRRTLIWTAIVSHCNRYIFLFRRLLFQCCQIAASHSIFTCDWFTVCKRMWKITSTRKKYCDIICNRCKRKTITQRSPSRFSSLTQSA